MLDEIESVIKKYIQAFYSQDFETMYDLLYEDDAVEYRSKIVSFAKEMDAFGETKDFLKQLKVDSLEELEATSTKEFMVRMFKIVTRSLGEKELKKIFGGIRITNIDEAEVITTVFYDMPIKMWDEWDVLPCEANLLKSNNEWKMLFKSGLDETLDRFQSEMDNYYERKSRDKLENFQFEGDLTKYHLIGYKNIEGKIVFEARFQDVGGFNNGLAPVKIMRKYGYLDLKGEIAIKPQFLEARDFSQGRAAVKIKTDVGDKWGFINKRGKVVVPFAYDEVSSFSQGFCAVNIDEHWGYIDKKGEVQIPLKFIEADDFSNGSAFVSIISKKGNHKELRLNKKGEIID